MTLGHWVRIRRSPARLAVMVLAACCLLTGTPASAASADSWPSETAGGSNSSYNAGESVLTAATAARARLTWSTRAVGVSAQTLPTVVGGQVYRVSDAEVALSQNAFEVRSARTGIVSWKVPLPGNVVFHQGITVDEAHSLAIVSWQASGGIDGVLAVDLAHRRIAWTRSLPKPRYSWSANPFGARSVVSDGTRIYVADQDNAVLAFRLTDGTALWSVPLPLAAPQQLYWWWGTAAAAGVVYVGTGQGLTAYDAASGRRLWSAAAPGRPLVAGGRVFVARPGGITALNAAGCGASTCPALWKRELGPSDTVAPGDDGNAPRIGGASASTLFATYFDNSDDMHPKGWLVRLDAATGIVRWSARTLPDPGIPARGGDVVWLVANPGPQGVGVRSVVAYSATGSSTTPLFSYSMPVAQRGFYGGIAVSGGTAVVQQYFGLMLAFRVPGT